MDNHLEALRSLVEAEDFDGALSLISEAERARSLTPSELLLKGRCIQLASGMGTPSLREAERALLGVLEQEKDYVPALLELGWFYFSVEDDAGRALPLFERALTLSLEQLKEAIDGKIGCLEEIQSSEAAGNFYKHITGSALVDLFSRNSS